MTPVFSKDNARKAVYFTVLFRTAAQISTLVGSIILIRLLTEAEFGVYSLLYSILPVLSALVSFGIANTLGRYLPEYYKNGEFTLANRMYKVAAAIRLATNILFMAIILVFWDNFADWFKLIGYKDYFLVFCIVGITYFQMRLLSIGLSAHLLQKFSQSVDALLSIAKVAGYSIAYFYGFSLWSALIVDAVASVIALLVLKYLHSVHIARKKGGSETFSREEKKRIFRYAAFFNFNDAGILALDTRVDNFFIAALLNPVAVGAYAFCTRMRSMAERLLPTNYLLDVIQPLFFTLESKTDKQKVVRYFQLLVKCTCIAQIPMFFFMLSFHEEIIKVVFGGKFIEYGIPLIVVFGLSTLSAFQTPLGLVAQLEERAGVVFASKIFAIYNIIADIVLIPFFGVMGAVLATGTAVLFKNLFVWWYVREGASFRGMGNFFATSVAFWLAFSVAGWGFKVWLSDSAIVLLVGVLLLLLWSLLYLRLPLFSNDEKKAVADVGSEKEKKILKLILGSNGS